MRSSLLLVLVVTACAPSASRESSRDPGTQDADRAPVVDARRAPPGDAAPTPVDAAPAPLDAAQPRCGRAACGAGEFCEERFKGHDLDAKGRPLHQKKCMPLPARCRDKPTCACVTTYVAATHCDETGGLVHTSDYPD
jgi:hypothetical protein